MRHPPPPEEPLDLVTMRSFVLFATYGLDTVATARALGISQSSLWKRLDRLRSRSGRPWLRLTGKTWALTEDGEAALALAREIVRLSATLEKGPPPTTPPGVRFGCGQRAAATFVRDAVKAFRVACPDVTLRVATLRGAQRVRRVTLGALDLATVTHSEPAIRKLAGQTLYTRPIRTEPLVVAAGAHSPWGTVVAALPAVVRPRDLAGLPLILPEENSGMRRQFDAAVRTLQAEQRLDVVLEVGGWDVLLQYVRDGLGVGIAGSFAAASVPELTLRPLDPKAFPPMVTRVIACADARGEPDLSPTAREFLDRLIAAARGR